MDQSTSPMDITLAPGCILRYCETDEDVLRYNFVELLKKRELRYFGTFQDMHRYFADRKSDREKCTSENNVKPTPAHYNADVASSEEDDDSESIVVRQSKYHGATDSVAKLVREAKLLGKYRIITCSNDVYSSILYVLPNGYAINHEYGYHVRIPQVLLKIDNPEELIEREKGYHSMSVDMSWPKNVVKILEISHVVQTKPLDDEAKNTIKDGNVVTGKDGTVTYKNAEYGEGHVFAALTGSQSLDNEPKELLVADGENYISSDLFSTDLWRAKADVISVLRSEDEVVDIYKVVALTRKDNVDVYILNRPENLSPSINDIREFLCKDHFYVYTRGKLVTYFNEGDRKWLRECHRHRN